jgi:hypothetical protein
MPAPLRFCFDDWHGILFQLSHPDPHASSRHVNERQEFASMRIVHMQAIVATMSRDDIPAPAQLRFRSVCSNAGEELVLQQNIFIEKNIASARWGNTGLAEDIQRTHPAFFRCSPAGTMCEIFTIRR